MKNRSIIRCVAMCAIVYSAGTFFSVRGASIVSGAGSRSESRSVAPRPPDAGAPERTPSGSAHTMWAQKGKSAQQPALPKQWTWPPQTPEQKRVADVIDAQVRAECEGKDRDDAAECWLKKLWEAAQCPPVTAMPANANSTANGAMLPCEVKDNEFAWASITVARHKGDLPVLATTYDQFGNVRSLLSSTAVDLQDGYICIGSPINFLLPSLFREGMKGSYEGVPDWVNHELYDIDAKYSPGVADGLAMLSPTDRRFILRKLHEDILKLGFGFVGGIQIRQVPAFDLLVAESGSKLKEAGPKPGASQTSMEPGRTTIEANAMTMAALAQTLSSNTKSPVNDKTGLTGRYRFTLDLVKGGGSNGGLGAAPDPSGAAAAKAIAKLGLKLVPATGLMQVLVIEKIEERQ